jgi:hypothetical protein
MKVVRFDSRAAQDAGLIPAVLISAERLCAVLLYFLAGCLAAFRDENTTSGV